MKFLDDNTKYALFLTPQWVVDFMVGLVDWNRYAGHDEVKILEPGCGYAQFLKRIAISYPSLASKSKFYGVELNPKLFRILQSESLPVNFLLFNADYLLWQPGLQFDLIIGNPPYGIPANSPHYKIKVSPEIKNQYKRQSKTWYGKYNLYGLFIEKSIKLLKNGGFLVFIVPATFMVLDDFKKLRKFLADNGQTQIIYLGSEVFKPAANVSVVILKYEKTPQKAGQLQLLEYKNNTIIEIFTRTKWSGEIVSFRTEYTDLIESLYSYRLSDIYDIRISPRTSEIRRNPYIVKAESQPADGYLPLLTSKNLTDNGIIYNTVSSYWVAQENLGKIREFFKIPHIVVGLGFRGRSRILANYDAKCYPWFGDVYHLIPSSEKLFTHSKINEIEVMEYLNSHYVSRYVTDKFRDIVYHLSSTLLGVIPIPCPTNGGEKQCLNLNKAFTSQSQR